jgi:hypothetical protein
MNQAIRQNTIQLALEIKIKSEIGYQQSEQKMWLLYLKYKIGNNNTRETSIHVLEIARAIKIIQESKKETDRQIKQTAGKPLPTPSVLPKTRYKKRKRSRQKGKETRDIFLDQLAYKKTKITEPAVIDAITNRSTNIRADITTSNMITNHKPTKGKHNTEKGTKLEIGNSGTRIDSCNSCSKGSSNDSAASNSSLIRRLKARTQAQRAWIESQAV